MFFEKVAPTKTVESEGTAHETTRIDHDAFGQISVVHTSFNRGTLSLFGSDINHQSAVCIKIKRAHQNRRSYQNEVVEDEPVVELYMSEAQWARFVAGPGTGIGTPVTLRQAPVRGSEVKGMPGIESESMQQQMANDIQRKFAAYMARATEIMERMDRMAEKGSIGKTEFRELQKMMSALAVGLPNTFSFMQEQFHETMDDTAQQLKTEMEAFVTNLARHTGLEHIRNGGVASLPFAKDDEESK